MWLQSLMTCYLWEVITIFCIKYYAPASDYPPPTYCLFLPKQFLNKLIKLCFFSQATLDDVKTKVSHVLTPNNSSVKSRGNLGEKQADVTEQLLNLTVDVTEISEAVHRQSRKLAELVCELISYYWLFCCCCCCWCLFTWIYFLCVFWKLIKTQLSKAHVMRVECNLLPHKRVGVTLQATVEKLYEK